jgi:hypothetical protein
MNPPVKHLAVFQLLFRYPFPDKGEFLGLDEILKNQETKLNVEGSFPLIGFADSHFSGKYLIGLVEDRDVVALQKGIVRGEAPLKHILTGKTNKGFPQFGVKLKVLDGFPLLFDPFFHVQYPYDRLLYH